MSQKEFMLAMRLAEDALARNRWTKIDVDGKGTITLEVGPFKFNGEREYKSATYQFYSDAIGEPHFIVYAHP